MFSQPSSSPDKAWYTTRWCSDSQWVDAKCPCFLFLSSLVSGTVIVAPMTPSAEMNWCQTLLKMHCFRGLYTQTCSEGDWAEKSQGTTSCIQAEWKITKWGGTELSSPSPLRAVQCLCSPTTGTAPPGEQLQSFCSVEIFTRRTVQVTWKQRRCDNYCCGMARSMESLHPSYNDKSMYIF